MTENIQNKMTTSNKSNIYNGKEAIEGIARGINAVADIVGTTLGAKGKNVIIEAPLFPFHIITNDGISIAEACFFEDPLEQRGADLVKEVNKLTDRGSGDGRTTTTVLMQAIINEGLKSEASGIEIRNSLQELIPFIEQKIDEQKKEITIADVASVATIAGENPEMGKMIQEIYEQIGKDGIIELDNSKTDTSFYTIKEGVRFEYASLVSQTLANQDGKAVYKKPLILVTKSRLSTNSDIEGVLQILLDAGKKDLIIFCDDMDNGLASALIATHLSGQFNIAIIKAPTIWKDYIFEDFAKVTGSTIISDANGLRFKDIKLEHLGTCDKITTDKYETTIVGIADISEHLAYLGKQDDDDNRRRVMWLNTKAAILKVGAGSESDLSYLKRKTADAIHASRLALQDGVVMGGGISLLNVSKLLPDTIGGNILKETLEAPIKKIILNSGLKDVYPFFEAHDGSSFNIHQFNESEGFDAKKGWTVDMWEAQILDPALVVKNSIRNAINVASIVLTAGGVITKKPLTEEEKAQNLLKTMRPF